LRNDRSMTRDYEIRYETFFGPKILRCRDLYHLESGQGFQLAFCAYLEDWDQVEPVFNSMIDSFRPEQSGSN
jgi:hypothetical protein